MTITFEVHFNRLADWHPASEGATVTRFSDPEAALAHAASCLTGPYYRLRIHNTATDQWLSFTQFNRWLKTGDAFGPLLPQPDGSIL